MFSFEGNAVDFEGFFLQKSPHFQCEAVKVIRFSWKFKKIHTKMCLSCALPSPRSMSVDPACWLKQTWRSFLLVILKLADLVRDLDCCCQSSSVDRMMVS
jgi:hypothetical protein